VSLFGAMVFAVQFVVVVLLTGKDPLLRDTGPALIVATAAVFLFVMIVGFRLYRRPSLAGVLPAFITGDIWLSISAYHVWVTVTPGGFTHGPLALAVVGGLLGFSVATILTAVWTSVSLVTGP